MLLSLPLQTVVLLIISLGRVVCSGFCILLKIVLGCSLLCLCSLAGGGSSWCCCSALALFWRNYLVFINTLGWITLSAYSMVNLCDPVGTTGHYRPNWLQHCKFAFFMQLWYMHWIILFAHSVIRINYFTFLDLVYL